MADKDGITLETKTYEQPKPAESAPASDATEAQAETQEPVEPTAATETEAAPETPETEQTTTEEKPSRAPKWVQPRINALVRQKGDLERENTALKAELAAKANNQPQADQPQAEAPPAQPTKPAQAPNIDELVNLRAQQLLAQQTYQNSLSAMAKRGGEEFSDFQDRCNFLADIGAGDNPNFLPAVSALEDGHKVLAELADKPEEAQRILSLAPIQMAAELGRMSAKLSAPKEPAKPEKKISTAPAPIKPIDGSAKGDDKPSPDDDDAAWFAKRAKQREEKRQVRGARF